MLDKIILGLLQIGPHSAYSLQKNMERSTSMFYGASQGSINPALKKLSAAGHVTGTERLDGNRRRVEYEVTALGQQAFEAWLDSAMEVGRVRDDALVRLFFLGHLDKAARVNRVRAFCAELKANKAALQAMVQGTQAELKGRTLTDVETCRLETLRFGADYYRFSLNWYEGLLKRMEAS